VYRNADTIATLARRISLALDASRHAYRVVFVVDASPDNSWRVVEQLAQRDSRISGLLLGRNQGQHRALMLGLKEVRARWVAVMDADLQDPPELLPVLIEECERTGHTVFARRSGRYQGRGRMLTSRLFKSVLSALVGMPADVGTYFVVADHVAERMRNAKVKHVQMVVMARLFSNAWRGVRYSRSLRSQGESAYSALGRLRSAVTSLACAWECRGIIRRNVAGLHSHVLPPIAARVNI
jgi:glycosyltransferase involved in cell wall biosynthesis